MKFPKYYIGPMSKNVVDCVIKHGQLHHVGLIPSRRQVDYFGGYVNNWDNEFFTYYLKSKNPHVLICRDHGGAKQGQIDDDGLQSLESDCNFFDLIHLDPFRDCNTIGEAAQKTVEYINYCYSKNPHILYEVGTEQAIFKYEPKDLKEFLNYLKLNLNPKKFYNIKYAVVQSGTGLDLSTRTNIGTFNKSRLVNFVDVVKSFGLFSKEHNGDYLSESFDVETRFSAGLDAINIAPEFGQIESEYYLEECKKDSKLFEVLYEICYNSGKWKKWIPEISRVSKEQIIITCCHYILSNKEFIQKIKSNFPNSDKIIKKRISSKLKLLHEQTKDYCF
jgi:hypothetical protein